ncbi:MAG TPA: hypothetical protein PLC42_02295 [Parachlamydiaceae bacterium]|nr:hypothetical protein [Parachlamydiaceae bacterium]
MFRLSMLLAFAVSSFLAAENEEITAARRAHAPYPHAADRARVHHDLNGRAAYPYGNPGVGETLVPVTTYPVQTIPSQTTIQQSTTLPGNQVRQN